MAPVIKLLARHLNMSTHPKSFLAQSVAAAGLLLAATCLFAADPVPPKTRVTNVAPLPPEQKVLSSHAAFEGGDCAICHQNADPHKPGPINGTVNQLCLDCHDDFKVILARKSSHAAATASCTNCHNPHNAALPKLLVDDISTGCLSCHEKVKDQAVHTKVPHGAVSTGGKCINCHNPHGSDVEHLLTQLPMNQCLGCHDKDNVIDHHDKPLTNMKKLLEENPRHHGPVASGDCTACHNPHGFDNFRLLNQEYPAQFYSPFKIENYALCFECHEERMITDAETTTQTRFRDGRQNLHYLHVNKAERGRTCRACHEVHASKQKALLRESVPYGPKNWPLKLNYTKTETGGTCTKTCHTTRSYNNTAAPPVLPKRD